MIFRNIFLTLVVLSFIAAPKRHQVEIEVTRYSAQQERKTIKFNLPDPPTQKAIHAKFSRLYPQEHVKLHFNGVKLDPSSEQVISLAQQDKIFEATVKPYVYGILSGEVVMTNYSHWGDNGFRQTMFRDRVYGKRTIINPDQFTEENIVVIGTEISQQKNIGFIVRALKGNMGCVIIGSIGSFSGHLSKVLTQTEFRKLQSGKFGSLRFPDGTEVNFEGISVRDMTYSTAKNGTRVNEKITLIAPDEIEGGVFLVLSFERGPFLLPFQKCVCVSNCVQVYDPDQKLKLGNMVRFIETVLTVSYPGGTHDIVKPAHPCVCRLFSAIDKDLQESGLRWCYPADDSALLSGDAEPRWSFVDSADGREKYLPKVFFERHSPNGKTFATCKKGSCVHTDHDALQLTKDITIHDLVLPQELGHPDEWPIGGPLE